jgi:hypothetical protein
MATTYLNSERFGVNFEDRVNKLVRIDPQETPLTNEIAKNEAKSNAHKWQAETLDEANADNAAVEGSDASFAAGDFVAPTDLLNYTQTPRRSFSASFTQDAISKPGMGSGSKSAFNHEKAKKMIVLKLDGEKMMFSNNERVAPAPESGTAGKLRGITRWITTNAVDATAKKYAGGILSQDMFDDCAQKCVDEGGRPGHVYMNSNNKRQVNRFVGRPERDISSQGKKLVDVVDMVESIAGPQRIIFARQIATSTVLMLEMKYWTMSWLRAPESWIVGLKGPRTEGFCEMEFTVEALAEESSGKITGLKVA